MSSSGSIILLFSASISVIATLIVLSIFKRVYQENYKKPWLYIGISTLFLATSQILRFLQDFYDFTLINLEITFYIFYILEFIAIAVLTYGLVFELLILKYYKGKFVKVKFIPVQEGTLGGELDINVSEANSYLTYKKDSTLLYEQFSQATKKGFEGFLLTEKNPTEIRNSYKIQKTPIAWITHFDHTQNDYLKQYLDENSDLVDPLQINNIISYIDNFYEQSQNPFILLDLNLIYQSNNFPILLEFLRYLVARNQKFRGVLICLINIDINTNHLEELKTYLKDLE